MAAVAHLQPTALRPTPRRTPPPTTGWRAAPARLHLARAALAALAVVVALLVLRAAGGAGDGAAPAPLPVAAPVHVVQPGDTLWSIARTLQPQGDVRPLVARLGQLHGDGPLVPGERLALPASPGGPAPAP